MSWGVPTTPPYQRQGLGEETPLSTSEGHGALWQKQQVRALQLGFPALGEQHHPGHPAREMEEGETHQEVQPKPPAEQDELALASRARGLIVEGDSWT